MLKMNAVITIGAVLASIIEPAMATQLQELPIHNSQFADGKTSAPDWLLDSSPYKASVSRTDHADELVLDNGLVRRTFRLAPNAATVGLDNLVTGQALLRGVKPEAMVEIDGIRYDVGGLKGQPNYAYLLPEWLDTLTVDPYALQFVGFEVDQPKERMGWKRVRHHAPDVEWPPKGVHVRFDYRLPDAAHQRLQANENGEAPESDFGRPLLFKDDLLTLDSAWQVTVSKAHERSSFENEGKVGEIYTPENTAVVAERALPAGTRQVEVVMDVGTDRSATWGPGIALVFPGRALRFHFRPGGGRGDVAPRFGGSDTGRELERVGGRTSLDVSKPWTLRMRIVGTTVFCDARIEGGTWKTYHAYELGNTPPEPTAVRVGKMDKHCEARDFGTPGELVRMRVMQVAAYGDISKEMEEKRFAKLKTSAIRVSVHYELYDGVPVMSKWLTVHNGGDAEITVNRFSSEILAVVERDSWVTGGQDAPMPVPDSLHVETDFAFASFNHEDANWNVVHWRSDPQYSTQVSYSRATPCLLVVEPTYGPAQVVKSGGTFESCRAFELVYDSTERERRSLSLRRMYRTIAPWVTENPLMHHLRNARDPQVVRNAIDQAAEVGFEMVIMSFRSGFNMENESPEYLNAWKAVGDYAASKGIDVGGYSLLSSRNAGGSNNVISPPGIRPRHGKCPCPGSIWGQDYFRKLYKGYEANGHDILEHDGSYPGDLCTSTTHPGHKGIDDSRWNNWTIISDFYKWCRAKGIYLNIPDYYYLSGASKCGMGYRETNWSLPRAQQVIHTRQNIYDGTWNKTPSMGWMFVPLTQYHGGGAAATIEPLDTHIDHYRRMIQSNLALGVQACYRGPRLYDTDRVRDMVKSEVDWFKQYRDILESDVIHGRRADGRDVDWMLHVNPALKDKGMLIVFNPLKEAVTRNLKVNLYYTGVTEKARVSLMGAEATTYPLARDYTIDLSVTIPAEGMVWYVIR